GAGRECYTGMAPRPGQLFRPGTEVGGGRKYLEMSGGVSGRSRNRRILFWGRRLQDRRRPAWEPGVTTFTAADAVVASTRLALPQDAQRMVVARRQRRRAPARGFHPFVEGLEERWLLSAVLNPCDSGPRSPRDPLR